MSDILNTVKRYGRFLALIPLLSAVTVTLPKLYLEVIGTDVFGTREILQAEVVEKFRTEAFVLSPESCHIKLKIMDRYQQESLDCADWNQVHLGDVLERVDAWTVFNTPDEASAHAAIDLCLLLIEIAITLFLLNIRRFIEWVERQTKASSPIFTGNSQRKENI